MTKSIINPRGAYVTAPEDGNVFFIDSLGRIQERYYQVLGHYRHFYNDTWYISKEAAEAALLRATSQRRLEEMAYENWLPDFREFKGIYGLVIINTMGGGCIDIRSAACGFERGIEGIYFNSLDKAEQALASLTQAEKDAWLYTYKNKP